LVFTTFSSGTKAKSSEVNNNFLHTWWSVSEVYSGTALNVSIASTGTASANRTFTVSAGTVNYVRLVCLCEANGENFSTGTGTSDVNFKIESSVASAGSWTERLNHTIIGAVSVSGQRESGSRFVEFVYAPTAGEKTGGLDLRVTVTLTSVGNADSGFTLKQLVVYKN